ncbi:MAG TPA: hypothetical protein PK605_00320 [Ignavibacteria bacterium]|nr:hypothetical protein [Bacteroidota bacterium]HRF65982.1 hypothetical protein [Ignavibacteria bacterium]HRJ02823.1 hypothetical protein [Ignavibacteria bacterium]HRJ84381.1 hypothetical protein [Ignavibacteria bacterium]
MTTEKLVLSISDVKKQSITEVEQYYGRVVSLTYIQELEGIASVSIQYTIPTAVYEKIKPIIKVLKLKTINGVKNAKNGRNTNGSKKQKSSNAHRNRNGLDKRHPKPARKRTKESNR